MSRIVIAGLDNIAQEMGCSKKTLYKWIKARGFPAFKMDGVWRALPKEMEEWTRRQRDSAAREGRTASCRRKSQLEMVRLH